MKILSIIGTRPQYIKLKPFYEYAKDFGIEHIIVDTNQHFTNNVSSVFIEEFNLYVDYNLHVENVSPSGFISSCMSNLEIIVEKENPDFILVMGDTNSTLAAALVSKKMEIGLGHIESGIRCGDKSRPEEINRILTDEMSDVHFISRKQDHINVLNPIYTGCLEYSLLNQMYETGQIEDPTIENWVLMTLHREENTNKKRITEILDKCYRSNYKFIFPIHHRAKKIIEKHHISVPKNIDIIEPQDYIGIVKLMSRCMSMFSDSGGLAKVSPFFGKKCLIPSSVTEYDDLLNMGYTKLGMDFDFLRADTTSKIDREIYYMPNCCELIYGGIF